ncbi:MAG: Shedu anti-phage system protein SduA domain-containing protein [Bacteroidota bacterium]
MPKLFKDILFDYNQFKTELTEFETFLNLKKELSEQKDIQPFFKARPLLSSQIATAIASISLPNKIAFEYNIFGDFGCDLAIGNTENNTYCFIEFEDARKNSLFKEEVKYKSSFGQRLEHGYSQIIDWFCKIEAQSTREINDRFGVNEIDYYGILIIGRNCYLESSLRHRLDWRSKNLELITKKINIVTFDDLLEMLQSKLHTIDMYRK